MIIASAPDELRPGSLLYSVLHEIRSRPLNVSVAVLGQRFEFPDELGVPVSKIRHRFENDLFAAIQIRRLAKSSGATIVHAWGPAANRLVKMASVKAPWNAVSTKLDLLDNEDWKLVGIAGRRSKQNVVVVSHPLIELLLQGQGLPAEQIQRIRIGAPEPECDLNGIPPANSLLVPDDHFIIVTRARFLPENRLKDLVWATDLLQCVRSDFRFLVFGEGPQEWRLRRYARQTTADSKMVFMNNNEDYLRWLSRADLYWHPTSFSPRPFELIAALRAGVPVLAAKSSALAELISDGVEGLLFDEGQRDQIARITNAILDNPEKLEQMKTNAKTGGEGFQITDTVDDLMAIYRGLTV